LTCFGCVLRVPPDLLMEVVVLSYIIRQQKKPANPQQMSPLLFLDSLRVILYYSCSRNLTERKISVLEDIHCSCYCFVVTEVISTVIAQLI
jgi:hypothetical protein